jgi:hypothetical protein
MTVEKPPPRKPLEATALEDPNLRGFQDRLRSLLKFDEVRITRIFEILQYAFLFTLFAVAVGYSIDRFFSQFYVADSFDEQDKLRTKSQVARTLAIISLQIMFGAVCVFYIRKVVDLVNPVLNLNPAAYIKHRNVSEASGELAFAIAFIGIQVSAIRQLEKIRAFGQE